MIDVIYSMQGAGMAGESRHPQLVMKDMGITYVHCVPQSISDSWWFFGCENFPESSPNYIRRHEFRSYDALVGYGLSSDDAKMLNNRKVDE